MRNLTVSLEDEVAKWARVYAAEHDMSVSRMVAETLREKMSRERAYEAARKRFFAREPRRLKRSGTAYPKREAVYDR